MAKTNKYTSINFNDIYEKKVINNTTSTSSSPAKHPYSPSSSSAHQFIARLTKSYSVSTSSRSQGGMLVLSRPSSKPLSQPPPPPPVEPPQQQRQHFEPLRQQALPASSSDQPRFEPDTISLRPLGKTGSGPFLSLSSLEREREGPHPLVLPKSEKFIPPHLRSGFAAKEPKPVQENQRQAGGRRSGELGNYQFGKPGSPMSKYGEDGRPRSGGGYERPGSGGGYGRNLRRGGESDLGDLKRPRSGGIRPKSSG
ncbi:hypothetical protein Ancab_007776 [Ancistrocladus abbreviatus]